jgi:hypothetical protein
VSVELFLFSGKSPEIWPSKIKVSVKQMVMKKWKTNIGKTSMEASSQLDMQYDILVKKIEEFLDENKNLIFEENVNMSFFDEEMRLIMKRNERYVLLTVDNKYGTAKEHDVNDQSSLCIDDMIWIVMQIEKEEGS